MSIARIVLVSVIGLTFNPKLSLAKLLTLSESLKLVRKEAIEYRAIKANSAAIAHRAKGVKAKESPIMYGSAVRTHDGSYDIQQIRKEGEKDRIDLGSIGLKQQSSLGLSYDISVNYNKLHRTNAEITSQALDLEVEQSLWRNFNGRELALEERLAHSRQHDLEQKLGSMEQSLQSEVETLFISLSAARLQQGIMKKIKKETTRYLNLMTKRSEFGRSEDLDIAAARSRNVQSDGNLLNINIKIENLEARLAYRLSSFASKKGLSFKSIDLTRSLSKLPSMGQKKLETLAKSRRHDLEFIKRNIDVLQAQIDLASERNKPHVGLFGSGQISQVTTPNPKNIDEDETRSFEKYSVGLRFSMSLGGRQYDAERLGAVTEISALNYQEQDISYHIKRDIHLTLMAYKHAEKQKLQALNHMSSLQRQLEVEQKRYRQARSDEVASVAYILDILQAENEKVIALENMRLSEAKLRLVTHAYQRS